MQSDGARWPNPEAGKGGRTRLKAASFYQDGLVQRRPCGYLISIGRATNGSMGSGR
jgi:hypothetical protein